MSEGRHRSLKQFYCVFLLQKLPRAASQGRNPSVKEFYGEFCKTGRNESGKVVIKKSVLISENVAEKSVTNVSVPPPLITDF